MPNKCASFGCCTNYDSKKKCYRDAKGEKVSTFYFPLQLPNLLPLWVKFVNRAEWTPSKYSVLCEKHFEEKLIKRGKERNKLQWNLSPIPSQQSLKLAP